LQPRCRACCAAASKARRDANLEAARAKERARYAVNGDKHRASNHAWRERNPEQVTAIKRAWYQGVRDNPDFIARVRARAEATKEEKRLYDREYRAKNKEKCRKRARAWKERNPDKRRAILKAYTGRRRAQTASGVGGKELGEWISAQPKRCYWCGKACAKSFHVDHYTPLSKGGEHEIHNLVIACPPCNLKKNAKDPLAFAREVGRLL